MERKGIIEQLIVRFAHGNQSEFARLMGCQSGVVSGWLRRNTYDPERIKRSFPQVDGNWLLTGEGEMLLPDGKSNVQVNGHHNTTQVNSSGNIETPSTATFGHPEDSHSLEVLQRENTLLKDIIAEKERLISVLLNREQGTK